MERDDEIFKIPPLPVENTLMELGFSLSISHDGDCDRMDTTGDIRLSNMGSFGAVSLGDSFMQGLFSDFNQQVVPMGFAQPIAPPPSPATPETPATPGTPGTPGTPFSPASPVPSQTISSLPPPLPQAESTIIQTNPLFRPYVPSPLPTNGTTTGDFVNEDIPSFEDFLEETVRDLNLSELSLGPSLRESFNTPPQPAGAKTFVTQQNFLDSDTPTPVPAKRPLIEINTYRRSTCNAAFAGNSCVQFEKMRIGKTRKCCTDFSPTAGVVEVKVQLVPEQKTEPQQLFLSVCSRKQNFQKELHWVNSGHPLSGIFFYIHVIVGEKKTKANPNPVRVKINPKIRHFLRFEFTFADGRSLSTQFSGLRAANHKHETGDKVAEYHQTHNNAHVLTESLNFVTKELPVCDTPPVEKQPKKTKKTKK